jgi:hypothetical protein
MDITIKILNEDFSYYKTKTYKNLEEFVNEFKIIEQKGESKNMIFKARRFDEKIYYIKFLFDDINNKKSD